MKHMITRTLTSLMLVTIGIAMTAQAQSASVIKVNVPFEFTFGDQTFPAGDYSLTQPQQHLVVLRDSRGRTIAQTLTGGIESLTPATATELKFQSYGDQHILAEVWQQYQTSGERLDQVKNVTTLAKHRSIEARETAEGSRP